MIDHHRRFGPVFKSHVFGEVVVALLGAPANRFVLVDHAKSFSNEGGWATTIGELFAGGVMLMDGEMHRRHRSILQAAFRRQALEEYMVSVDRVVATRLDGWRDAPPPRIFDAVKELALDIAARVFVGLELDREVRKVNEAFLRLVRGTIAFVRRRLPGTFYTRAVAARSELSAFFRQVIAVRRADPGTNMLGRLMTAENEEGERLSDDEIIGHMIFLLMAAHDTTTSTITSLFYELGRHPEWQERLRGGEDPTAVVHETMRLHTPLVTLPRRTVEPVSWAGFDIPAGVVVSVVPSHTHRMEEYWTRPDDFDPERFLEPRAEHRREPCSFLPFGAGPHTCLGQIFAELEIARVLRHALDRFRWRTPPGYVARYRQVPLQAPRDGLPIALDALR